MSTAPIATEDQKRICAKYRVEVFPCDSKERAGVAVATLKSEPLYGVRKKNEDGTASWYIWGGPYSEAIDSYQPLCVGHLDDLIPNVLPYLALPPGYKFIIDRKGFEDVWREDGSPARGARLT